MREWLNKHWIKTTLWIGIWAASFRGTLDLPILFKQKWWIGLFLIALFFSGIYEITIKIGKQVGMSKSSIIREIIWLWILPLALGYVSGVILR